MTMMTTPPLDQEDEEMLVPHSDFVEGPQSMEVVSQVESSSTVENQPVEDPPSSRFTWTIENFSRLNTKKHYSDVFVIGSYKWRVLIYPKGNNVDHFSMYLDVADSSTLPYGWSRYAQFSLSVVSQIHNKFTIRKETQHQFNASESDWGFTSFMPLGELYDPGRGYLVNDTCIVEAEVVVCRVLDYWTYDSKKETGYVGLKNQGATCYMNSLLQTLYHIPYFRKAVYHMPTTENDMPSGSIPLALQSLFSKLQYNDHSVATKELTESFGWDTYDSFVQHDVQELNRVLCEKLEDKMKGTVVEGTIQKLFEGHHMNYIECINVDYKSTRKESFYGLQLDVKGCQDVYASFDKYVEVECLDGDNKYHAEEHGLQDAKKGVLFIDFPPVLQLQLKRFEYDFMLDTMVKVNDRYEFPLQLDLDRENGKYLSPEADRSVRNLYTLHSVLVHNGGVHDGNYYAYIRPTLSDQWFKFDDERVTKEDLKKALEEQYGGEEELPQTNPGFNNTPFKFTKYSNAYMLVYIRESGKEKIICNVDEKDIAEHLRIRLKKEQEDEEDKRRHKAQTHLYTIIKVAQDEDLLEQIGRDIYSDLVDHDKVRSFRIQKRMPFNLFKEEVAKEFGIPVQYLRFWIWAKRQNHTYRPNRPLAPQEEAQSVGQLREVSNKKHNGELKLFLEVELGPDLRPVPLPDKTKEDILLFFKLYDPEKEELRYVGRLFVKSSSKPIEILTKLNGMAGFAPEEEIELYEEIKFEPCVMCEHLDKRTSFRFSQIEDGDIICFQKSPPLESEEQYRYPVVPSFLEYVHNRQIWLKKEQEVEEDKRRYKAQAHLYTIIKVAQNEDLLEQIGRDIYFDLVDHDKVRSFRIQKQMPFNLFKEEVAKEFGIPVQYLRFWIWAERQNHTYRPNQPLTPQEEAQSVGQLREVPNKKHNGELKLFLEVELGLDLRPVPLPDKTEEDILLFFKLYDPEKEELRYVGRLFVKSYSKPIKILKKLNRMAGFAPKEEIELYEEIKFEPCVMCERLDKRISFRISQIGDGDIICFQKSPPLESEEQCRYPVVPSFLEYVHNRQIVHFRSLERSKEDDFCLELSKLHNYDEVVERVARRIGLDDPSKIRLTAHNCYSEQPKSQPIKYRGVERLSDMLIHYNQTSDILYYEVLDIPLPELKGLKSLKVAFHQATKDEVVIHNIRLPKQSTVGDVLNELKTKVELSHPNAELRLLEVFYHKIYKIFPTNEKIESINDQYWTLFAEEVLSSTTVDPGIIFTPRAASPTLSPSPPSPRPTPSLAIIPYWPFSPPVFPSPTIITPPVSPVKVTVGTTSSPPSLVSSSTRPLSPSPLRSRQPSATPIISASFSLVNSKPASSFGPSAQLLSIEAILNDDWLSDAEEVPPRPIIEDSEVIQARLVIKNALNQNISYFLDTAAFDSFTKACTLLVSSPEIANPTKTFLATLPTSLQNAAINAYTAQTLLSQFKLLEAHNKIVLGQLKEHNDKLQSASLSRHQLLQSQQDISNQIKELQAQLAVVGDKLSSVDQELSTLAQATDGLVTSAVSSKADLKRSVAVRGEAQDTIAFCEQVLSRARGDSRLFL